MILAEAPGIALGIFKFNFEEKKLFLSSVALGFLYWGTLGLPQKMSAHLIQPFGQL